MLKIQCDDGTAENTSITNDGVKVKGVTRIDLACSARSQNWAAQITVEMLQLMTEISSGECTGSLSPETINELKTLPPNVLRDLANEMLDLAAGI